MATLYGAHALHLEQSDRLVGAGQARRPDRGGPGAAHNAPRFRREPEGLYAQLVYAGHAHDVTDVMVNGQWVMRDGQLIGLDEAALLVQAEDYARRIDQFLIGRASTRCSPN